MEEMHFHIRKVSNGFYVRVTKGFFDVVLVKRFIAQNHEDAAKEITDTLKVFMGTGV